MKILSLTKHGILQQVKNIVEKWRNCSSGAISPLFHNILNICLTSGVKLHIWGWSGGAKVLCILHHWGVQLILAYSWARPAILVVGKGRGGMFLFLLCLHFHSCSSFFPVPLFHLLYSLFLSLFSLSLGDDKKWPSRVDVSLNPNTINQITYLFC